MHYYMRGYESNALKIVKYACIYYTLKKKCNRRNLISRHLEQQLSDNRIMTKKKITFILQNLDFDFI